MIEINKIYNKDCLEGMKDIDDKSIDAICIDPPYTDGKIDVLKGHKIQTIIDIDLVSKEIFRIAKDNSFYVFFGQMPTIVAWHNAAIAAGFEFKESITWVKRNVSSPYQKVLRMKEEIYIYKKGNAKFNITKEPYEDIKMPLYLDGLLNIETIKRNISELKYEIKYGKKRILKRDKNNKNDKIHANAVSSETTNIESCNITNVWSFSPENKKTYNKEETNVKHPTVKPTLLLERLIKLISKEGDIILDCFGGSGTTFLSAINTNRNFIGFEIDKEYFDLSQERIEKHKQKTTENLFDESKKTA